jgi:tRNA pseudouridine38-40 synthase
VLKLTLQYDGTDYVGWQRQANGTSIQELVERALEPIEGRQVTVIGAGRTDAGVHAIGQIASVQVETDLGLAVFARALNATLPEAVRITDVAEAPPDFNARFSAKGKVYEYRIWNDSVVPPFDRRYVWHVPQALDVEAMREAARPLVGRHDFAAFRAAGSEVVTTERTMRELRIDDNRPRVTLTVAGDGFLRHMVRAIAGTLVEVGLGRRNVGDVAGALASRDRAKAGATAPALGLFLMKVEY